MASVPAPVSCLYAASWAWGSGGVVIGDGLKKYSEWTPSAGTFSDGLAEAPAGRWAAWSAHLPPVVASLSHATMALTRGSHWPTSLTADAPREWPAMPTREGSRSARPGLAVEK